MTLSINNQRFADFKPFPPPGATVFQVVFRRTSAVALVLIISVAMYAVRGGAQTVQHEEMQNSGAINFDSLPVDAETRRTLSAAVKSGNYLRAEQMLVAEINREPKSYSLLATLGGISFLDGNYVNCAIAMKKAEVISPLAEGDRYKLALAYVVLKQPDWAQTEFERLALSYPQNPNYVYWQGRIDYDATRFQSAASKFDRALAIDGKFMKAYDNLGLTYEALGDLDRAVLNYEQATALNRQRQFPSPWPPLNLGALDIKMNKLTEAESNLRESLQYDSRFPNAHYQLGRVLDKENKDGEALKELQRAAQYDPQYPEPHYAMAQIYQRTGANEAAQSEYGIFQKLKQAHPRARSH